MNSDELLKELAPYIVLRHLPGCRRVVGDRPRARGCTCDRAMVATKLTKATGLPNRYTEERWH